MSYADKVFVAMCQDILENGISKRKAGGNHELRRSGFCKYVQGYP